MNVYSSSDEWQALHDLPDGAILTDDEGHAYQVVRPKTRDGVERWPGETWLCPVSDEYAFVVRREATPGVGPRIGTYKPEGNLRLIWQPPS